MCPFAGSRRHARHPPVRPALPQRRRERLCARAVDGRAVGRPPGLRRQRPMGARRGGVPQDGTRPPPALAPRARGRLSKGYPQPAAAPCANTPMPVPPPSGGALPVVPSFVHRDLVEPRSRRSKQRRHGGVLWRLLDRWATADEGRHGGATAQPAASAHPEGRSVARLRATVSPRPCAGSRGGPSARGAAGQRGLVPPSQRMRVLGKDVRTARPGRLYRVAVPGGADGVASGGHPMVWSRP